MGKSTNYANSLLKHVFQNLAIAGYGDTGGLLPSAAAGNLWVSLHTGTPGAGDDQTVNEANYGAYARVAVVRSSGGWTVVSNTVTNAADVSFPKATSGSNVATHFGIGTAASGAGHLPYSFPICSAYFDATATASGDLITAPGHTFAVNDQVIFIPAPGATVPAGITVGTVYYVKAVSGNTLTISTTQGGSTLDITADGACLAGKVSPLTIIANVLPVFLAGTLLITEM